jgi:hypothetical protein
MIYEKQIGVLKKLMDDDRHKVITIHHTDRLLHSELKKLIWIKNVYFRKYISDWKKSHVYIFFFIWKWKGYIDQVSFIEKKTEIISVCISGLHLTVVCSCNQSEHWTSVKFQVLSDTFVAIGSSPHDHIQSDDTSREWP